MTLKLRATESERDELAKCLINSFLVHEDFFFLANTYIPAIFPGHKEIEK